MNKLLMLSVAVILGECAATVEQMYLPDGSIGYNIDCSANMWNENMNMGDCYEKASEIWGAQGYTIYGEHGEVLQGGFATAYGAALTAHSSKNLYVRCGQETL